MSFSSSSSSSSSSAATAAAFGRPNLLFIIVLIMIVFSTLRVFALEMNIFGSDDMLTYTRSEVLSSTGVITRQEPVYSVYQVAVPGAIAALGSINISYTGALLVVLDFYSPQPDSSMSITSGVTDENGETTWSGTQYELPFLDISVDPPTTLNKWLIITPYIPQDLTVSVSVVDVNTYTSCIREVASVYESCTEFIRERYNYTQSEFYADPERVRACGDRILLSPTSYRSYFWQVVHNVSFVSCRSDNATLCECGHDTYQERLDKVEADNTTISFFIDFWPIGDLDAYSLDNVVRELDSDTYVFPSVLGRRELKRSRISSLNHRVVGLLNENGISALVENSNKELVSRMPLLVAGATSALGIRTSAETGRVEWVSSTDGASATFAIAVAALVIAIAALGVSIAAIVLSSRKTPSRTRPAPT